MVVCESRTVPRTVAPARWRKKARRREVGGKIYLTPSMESYYWSIREPRSFPVALSDQQQAFQFHLSMPGHQKKGVPTHFVPKLLFLENPTEQGTWTDNIGEAITRSDIIWKPPVGLSLSHQEQNLNQKLIFQSWAAARSWIGCWIESSLPCSGNWNELIWP